MATWPATLPAPLANGYAVNPADATLRSDMETGAARARRISYARNDRATVSWVFTDAEFSAFRTWFESDAECAGGASWFYLTLRIGATGATTQEARFVGAWQSSMIDAGHWSVRATVEVR